MHYLIVSPTPIFPCVAGNRSHILAVIRQLKAAGHRVSFLYNIQEDITNESTRKTLHEVDAFYPCSFSGMKKAKAKRDVEAAVALKNAPYNYGLDDWYEEDVSSLVKIIFEEHPFDVLLVNYLWMTKVFEVVPANVIKILQTHDSMADRNAKLAEKGYSALWFSVSEADEGRAMDRADINISLQYAEEMFFRSLTDKIVRTVQFAPRDVPFKPRDTFVGRKLRVGYVGSDNTLNMNCVPAFVAALEKQPALHDRIELIIAGHICRVFKDKTVPSYVTVLGPCDDIDAFYESLDLTINPMEDGTGLKIKSVEALQYHCPIVMTQVASEGLLSPYGFHRCASIEAVVNTLSVILENPQRLVAMQAAGRKVLGAYLQRLSEASAALTVPQEVIDAQAARTAQSRQVLCAGRSFSFYEPQASLVAFLPLSDVVRRAQAVGRMVPVGGVWVDIGSRNGAFAVLAAAASQAARMIVMEWDPEAIEQIKLNVIANKLASVVDMSLLGFAPGKSAGYGVIEARAGGKVAVFKDTEEPLSQACVPFAPLDRLLGDKVEVAAVTIAMESPVDVLEGMAETLRRCGPVVFMLKTLSDSEGVATWGQKMGYALTQVDGADDYVAFVPPARREELEVAATPLHQKSA